MNCSTPATALSTPATAATVPAASVPAGLPTYGSVPSPSIPAGLPTTIVSPSVPAGLPTGPPSYTTEFVTHLTTYCPEAGIQTIGGQTITVAQPTTLTISDCSCTLTHPVGTPVATPGAPAGSNPAVPSVPAVTPVVGGPANPSFPATSLPAVGPGAPQVNYGTPAAGYTPTPVGGGPGSIYTGGASSMNVAKGFAAGAAGLALALI